MYSYGYIGMVYIVIAYILTAYIGMTYIVIAYILTAYIGMTYIVIAYIIMAYIGSAPNCIKANQLPAIPQKRGGEHVLLALVLGNCRATGLP